MTPTICTASRPEITRRTFARFLAAAAAGPVSAQTFAIRHRHDHVQGLEVSRDWFWISSVDRRSKTGWVWRVNRRTLETVAERNITQGPLYHPGGIQLARGSLWTPLAEYRPRSSARILELDAMTLSERRSFPVEDHIGAVATDGNGLLLGANWDARQIYRWSTGGKVLAVVEFPRMLAIQDMKWIGNILHAGGVGLGSEKGRCLVEQFDPSKLSYLRTSFTGGDPCLASEGMAYFEGSYFFLPEAEPNTRIYVRSALS